MTSARRFSAVLLITLGSVPLSTRADAQLSSSAEPRHRGTVLDLGQGNLTSGEPSTQLTLSRWRDAARLVSSSGRPILTLQHQFTLAAHYHSSLLQNPDLASSFSWDVAARYGLNLRTRRALVSISSGFALVRTIQRFERFDAYGGTRTGAFDPSLERRSFQLGRPIEAEVLWTPLQTVGVGVRAFGMYSPDRDYGGLGLVLRVGRLR